jgi:purine-binding chemotaxis protein CheW
MMSSYLLFSLSQQLFAVRLSGAIEILPWRASRPVPLSHPYVEGLLDYRNVIYPIYDLAQRLGRGRTGPIGFTAEQGDTAGKAQSIILLEEHNMPFGITVDSVVKMNKLEEQPAPPDKVQGIDPQYVKGFVHDDDQEIMILDFERLFHAD